MFEDFLGLVRQIDWTGYQVSVFEVLLVVFALLRRFNVLSLLIAGHRAGQGFLRGPAAHRFQRRTDRYDPVFRLFGLLADLFYLRRGQTVHDGLTAGWAGFAWVG